jgi:hypothetical protein
MSSVRASNTTDHAATPEQLRNVRARAWTYVFGCFHRRTEKKAAPASGPNDGTKVKEDSANEHRST